MKTIFDIGSNNGDDIPYYLLKADRVVAFEANPVLCRSIETAFADAIGSGRLVVENGIICADKDARGAKAEFYINKRAHVWSQFPRPEKGQDHEFTRVELPVRTLSAALEKYGTPHYAKIDIEHYDHVILSEFFRLNAHPTFLSAECHSREVVSLLLDCPAYTGFKLVDGETVQADYEASSVEAISGESVPFSFPHHSAGPFGKDIAGRWHDRASMLRLLRFRGTGWKDLHASRIDPGEEIHVPVSFRDYRQLAKWYVKPLIPESALRFYRGMNRPES